MIALMEDQRSVETRGGTMRLGAWPCVLAPDRLARRAYGVDQVSERHRHRYEFNNDYRKAFEEHGLVASGCSPDGTIVEIVELLQPPVVPRRAVPPRVQVQADQGPSPLPRLRRRRAPASRTEPRHAWSWTARSRRRESGRNPTRQAWHGDSSPEMR